MIFSVGDSRRSSTSFLYATPSTRIKRHETEGFGRRGVDHFPDVDVHSKAELFEFVDQRDVHAAENIFEQLGHFRRARRAYRNDAGNNLCVQRLRGASARRIQSANNFWNLRQT